MKDKELCKFIRKTANAVGSCAPIVFVDGCEPPTLVGKGFYYTNKRGDIIRYPSAYQKAWGKPIYHHSTKRIKVGKDWIKLYQKS